MNTLYKTHPALHEKQFSSDGFEWINYSDHQNAVLSFIRKGNDPNEHLIVVCNFTPVVRSDYRIGLPKKGQLIEIFNSDAANYEGSGIFNSDKATTEEIPYDGRSHSITLVLPALSVLVFKWV